MRLEQIIARLPASRVRGAVKLAVDGITCRSREAGPGKLFILLPEFQRLNPYQAFSAIQRGAAAVICPPGATVPAGTTRIEVDDSREAYARVAAAFLNRPGDKLHLIKVSGPRAGSVAILLHQLLCFGGLPTSLLGSSGCHVAGQAIPKPVGELDAWEVQDAFARMVRRGVKTCVVEMTPECTKARVFTGLEFSQSVDTDDLARDSSLPGLSSAGRVAHQSHLDFRRTRFAVRLGDTQLVVRSPVVGRRNAKDLLCALVAAYEAGVKVEGLPRAASRLAPVPGLLEPVNCGQSFGVLVDGARTASALADALKDARDVAPGRVIAVFGGPASMDVAGRHSLGQVASALADLVVVTSNDPGFADPLGLAKDIVVHGVPMARDGSIRLELDRSRAICLALRLAKPHDVVLIAGKGHRRTDEIEGAVIPFDDADNCRLALAERGYVCDEF